ARSRTRGSARSRRTSRRASSAGRASSGPAIPPGPPSPRTTCSPASARPVRRGPLKPLRRPLPGCHAAGMADAPEPAFERLLAEAGSVPLGGWDFSWFEGRATEERPRWGYSRLLAERMAGAAAALDIQTGGGEVLAQIPHPPGVLVATESWPPNVA